MVAERQAARSPSAGPQAVRRAAIANLGCRVNSSEMSAVARHLRAGGVALVGPSEVADLYVINTCTVTSLADRKSRHAVHRALAAGHREIVLTGINIGTYDGGSSEAGPRGSRARAALTLPGLVRRILAETEVERIRLSSIEPQHVDDDLLAAWISAPGRCLPHLHLPLQSGDDGVLRRMGRRYDTAGYAAVVERARAAIPGLAVHADVIAGFPTEDDDAHARTLAFLRSVEPAGLHVFRYSARAGTPATRMAGHADDATRKRRAGDLLALAAEVRARFAARQVGTEPQVLFEQPLGDGERTGHGDGARAGWWIGRAENNVLVIAAPTAVGRVLDNAIGRVAVEAVDPSVPDRVVGRLLALVKGGRDG